MKAKSSKSAIAGLRIITTDGAQKLHISTDLIDASAMRIKNFTTIIDFANTICA